MKRSGAFESNVTTSSNSRRTSNIGLYMLAFLLLAALSSLAQDAPATQTFSISGLVKSGNTPIPGATVTAFNSTGEKTATSTDLDGAYSIQVTAAGKYQLRVEMPAFAPTTREVVVENPASRADLELALLSRTQQAAHTEPRRERIGDFRVWR
jgi:hypothetical protein